MSRVFVLVAVLTTVLVGGALAAASATYLTLEGQSLQMVAGAIGVCGALVVPFAVGLGIVQSFESRGRSVHRASVVATTVLALHGATVGALTLAVPQPQLTLVRGMDLLLAPSQAEQVEEVEVVETPGPLPGTTAEVAAAQKRLAAVLAGHDAEGWEGLTNASAAAVGVVWMRHLEASWPELGKDVPPELYAAVYEGLTPRPGLWDDPAAVETTIVPRGRAFLVAVGTLADHLSTRKGAGPLTWPLLPEALVAEEARRANPAWTATYTRVERDRMEVAIAGSTVTLRKEAGDWRMDLGPYGEVASSRPDPRLMWLALRP
ncbi:MAG: hypothetical protein H6736_19810 [Alphaproteobacteria bacterium]|nr:hypothetical protein [Alphaproteobacteria bacterium]MCB9694060.1 hypothetical protein [Alphaproteobacteria bacterium]